MRSIAVAVFLALILALASPAFAKMGSGKSFGSRGSRTIDRPIERSITPPPAPVLPPAAQPSLPPPLPMAPAGGSSFLSGMAGGLLGAGLGSMLFGHSPGWAAASEAQPGASLLGLILQLAMIGGLIWLVRRWFRSMVSRPAPAIPVLAAAPRMTALAAPRLDKQFEPNDADKQAFAAILENVQAAWSAGDIAALRHLATPEVVAWLAEDLTANASRGIRNVVDRIELQKGEVIEAWRDGGTEYATAVLTFAARDFSVAASTGQVVEGDPQARQSSTEAWTFLRVPGGHWLLSAVERGQ